MGEINLLPDELRDKEERELRSIRKKPRRIRIEMSSPSRDKVEQPLKGARPSLLSRLFTKKTKPGAVIPADRQDAKPKAEPGKARTIEKIVNIPRTKGGMGVSLPASNRSSVTSVGGKNFDDEEDERAASFITAKGDNKESKVKFSSRSEKVIENIAKSSDGKKRGFLVQLFSSGKSKRKLNKIDKSAEKKKGLNLKKDDGRGRDVILDVNLIPEELNKHPELEIGKKLFSSATVIIIFLLLILVGYFGLIWYQSNLEREVQKVEEAIAILNSEIIQFEGDRIEAREFQKHLSLVEELLNQHVYWSQFFELLEKHVTDEVVYSNFGMTGTDKLVINALALDYEAVAEQMVAFQEANDFVKEVKINAASADIDAESGTYSGVSFTINLEFLPGIFLNPLD